MGEEKKDLRDDFPADDNCNLSVDGEEYLSLCALKRTLLTPREERVLARIRESQERAKDLKAHIKDLEGAAAGAESLTQARRELESLRRQRAELEEERIAAANERMRMLGHL